MADSIRASRIVREHMLTDIIENNEIEELTLVLEDWSSFQADLRDSLSELVQEWKDENPEDEEEEVE